MKIGVTGANGHLGSTLVRLLIEKGFSVRGLIHVNKNALKEIPIELYEGDICDAEIIDAFCKDLDIIVHCAGFIGIEKNLSETTFEINVEGTKNLVGACLKNKIKKLVHVSSIQAFKVNGKDIIDENSEIATSLCDSYSYSKQLGEQEIRKGIDKGLQACIVNPTSIIGPYDFNPGAQSVAILKIANRRIPALIKAGFDWVDVRDVAEGILGAIHKGQTNANYLLSGHWKTFKEVSSEINSWNNQSPIKVYFPIAFAEFGAVFQELWSKLSGQPPLLTREAMQFVRNTPRNISNQFAKETIDYQARPFEETIMDTLNWMNQQNWIK